MRRRPTAGTRPKTLRALLKPTAASLEAEAGMLMHRRERLEKELLHMQERSRELTTQIDEITQEVETLRQKAYAMESEGPVARPHSKARSKPAEQADELKSAHTGDDGLPPDSRFKSMVLDY
ncbi:MAG: hypothetical protein HY711_08565 [Candidatus Melainabacteria bacterium]|nr:hypothetical protein [Candidatus Melainabacteria bacterium]